MARKRIKLIGFKYPLADKSKLYLAKFKCMDNSEEFIKIGVTKHSVEDRFKNNKSFYTLVSYEHLMEGDEITMRGWESKLLSDPNFFKFKYKPKKHFEGYSECFQLEIEKDLKAITNYKEDTLIDDEIKLLSCILKDKTFAEHVFSMLDWRSFSDFSKLILAQLINQYQTNEKLMSIDELKVPEIFKPVLKLIEKCNVTDEIKIMELKRIKQKYIQELFEHLDEIEHPESILLKSIELLSPGHKKHHYGYYDEIHTNPDKYFYDLNINNKTF